MYETVLAYTGLICVVALMVTLTVFAITYLAEGIVNKTTAWMRTFRFMWRFYEGIPKTPFSRKSAYFVGVYDHIKTQWIRVEPLNNEFLTEEEADARAEELRKEFARKREEDEE